MYVLDRLKDIASKRPKDITDNDKVFVSRLAEGLGITLRLKTRCANCYIDGALQLYAHLNKAQKKTDNGHAYQLHEGVDVFFGSIRVNNSTLTDELAEQIVKKGFSTDYFCKMPK